MKKIIIVMTMLAMVPAMGSAQETVKPAREAAKAAKAAKPWTLTAGVGSQLYFGENELKIGRGSELAATLVDLGLTRWGNRFFGWGFGLDAFQFKGLYQMTGAAKNPAFATGKRYTGADPKWNYMNLAWQKGFVVNPAIYGHFNPLGFIGDGGQPGWLMLDIYAGPGALVGFGGGARAGICLNTGAALSFRFGEHFGILLNVRGAFVNDTFDGESYKDEPDQAHIDKNVKMDGMLGATLGISYRFGK